MRQLTVLILFAILSGCNSSKVDQKVEGEKLMQVSRDWAKSLSPDSLERTMSFWADIVENIFKDSICADMI